jgi:hypothetical protein
MGDSLVLLMCFAISIMGYWYLFKFIRSLRIKPATLLKGALFVKNVLSKR